MSALAANSMLAAISADSMLRTITAIAALGAAARGARAAGSDPIATTTVIVHGYSPSEKGAWVQGMAEAIVARAGGVGAVYRY
ncbi:MAG: hypothetical protein FJ253_10750, partial [Phycisphaerae bacterium]|nr:hypothetical protein [Phycisphaerae bacterium]